MIVSGCRGFGLGGLLCGRGALRCFAGAFEAVPVEAGALLAVEACLTLLNGLQSRPRKRRVTEEAHKDFIRRLEPSLLGLLGSGKHCG